MKLSFNHESLHHGFEKPVIHLDVCPDPDLIPLLGNHLSREILQNHDAFEEERILSASEVVDDGELGDSVSAIETIVSHDCTCNGEIVL